MNADQDTGVMTLMAFAIVLTYCAQTVLLIFFKVPADNQQLYSAAITALVSMATGITGWITGNAHGVAKEAARTRDALAAAIPAAQPNVAEVAADIAKKS